MTSALSRSCVVVPRNVHRGLTLSINIWDRLVYQLKTLSSSITISWAREAASSFGLVTALAGLDLARAIAILRATSSRSALHLRHLRRRVVASFPPLPSRLLNLAARALRRACPCCAAKRDREISATCTSFCGRFSKASLTVLAAALNPAAHSP
jgi:hypothetical protein